MRKLSLVLFAALFLVSAYADFPYEDYDLTEEQRDLIERLIQRGLDDELLHRLARNMEQQNNPPPPTYSPPHTWDELMAVVNWAEGGAFSSYASYAGVEFDGATYWNDCPNQALFNFGRATATQHLRVDVLSRAISRGEGLAHMLRRSPETFREDYIEQILKTPFAQYLIIK